MSFVALCPILLSTLASNFSDQKYSNYNCSSGDSGHSKEGNITWIAPREVI